MKDGTLYTSLVLLLLFAIILFATPNVHLAATISLGILNRKRKKKRIFFFSDKIRVAVTKPPLGFAVLHNLLKVQSCKSDL